MKYLKLLALLMLPLGFYACSDDDDFNGGNATVGFSESTLSIKENATELYVPIQVEGDHTGLVQVQVAVKDCQGVSVEADKNVILTSGTLNLPAEVNQVKAELRLSLYTSSDDLNRSFTLEITAANGAQVSTKTCQVKIEEAVDAYEKLLGNWVLVNEKGEGFATMELQATAGKDSYKAIMNYQNVPCQINVIYTPNGLEFVSNEVIVSGINFGDPIGVADVKLLALQGNQLYMQNIPATWNDTFNQIQMQIGMAGAIFVGEKFSGYTWFNAVAAVKQK